MTSLWTLESAQNQLPELIDAAIVLGPQTIVRDGDELVVVVSSHEWESIANKEAESFVSPYGADKPTAAGNLKSFICG